MRTPLKVLGAFAFLFLAIGVRAQSSFTIPVQNTSGAAITGATVTLACTDSTGGCAGLGPFSAQSANGNAVFMSIPAGNYTVTTSGAGISTYSYPLTVAAQPNGGIERPSSLNGIIFVDGVTYPQTGAGTNSALTAAGSGKVVEFPPVSATLSDTTITIPKNETLRFRGQGTYTVKQILFTDSTTDTTGTGNLECPEGATLKLANSANLDLVSQVNFATLTGGANTFGIWRNQIRGCILDGNKANQSGTSYCLRIFGRAFNIENLTTQNCLTNNTWTEGNQAAFTDQNSDLEATMRHTHHIFSGGAGFVMHGPNDMNIEDLISHNNTTWGTQYFASAHVSYENDYLNGSGGAEVGSGGQLSCSKSQFSAAAGVGLQLDNGSGATVCSDTIYACLGCTAILVNTQNVHLQGTMQNSTTGIQLNNASANGNVFDLTSSNVTGTQIAFTTGGGHSTYIINGNGSGNMTSGSIPQSFLNLDVISVTPAQYLQLPMTAIVAAGWTQTLPTGLNGTLLSTAKLLLSPTAPTILTHFNTSGDSISSNNGTAAFTVTVGTGTAGSTGAVTLPTATTGWICTASNRNRGAYIQQTGSSTTSATFTNYGTTVGTPVNWTNSDVLGIACSAY